MDIEIRWNSTHHMLDTALRMKKALSKISEILVESEDSTKTVIDSDDWRNVSAIVELLEPYYQCK